MYYERILAEQPDATEENLMCASQHTNLSTALSMKYFILGP